MYMQADNERETSEGLGSSRSRPSTVSDPGVSSCANSIFSSLSDTALSTTSQNSSIPDDTKAVTVSGRHASTGYGIIRSPPRNPLLVLFTRDPISSKRSIVSIKIDDGTRPNPERCNCQKFRDCSITALEQRRSALRAQRLENRAKWDLLPLVFAPDWSGLLRVSILFPSIEERYKFGGGQCKCKTVTEGDVDSCVSNKHQGLLGIVRVYHRRQMIMWQDRRNSLVGVDTSGWPDYAIT